MDIFHSKNYMPFTRTECLAAEGGRLLRKRREGETPQARGGSTLSPRKAATHSGKARTLTQ